MSEHKAESGDTSKPVRTGASARLTKIAADLIRASYDDDVERMAAALGNASRAVKREADLLMESPIRLGSCCINVGTDACRCERPTNWGIDFSRLGFGICPKCREDKFIGHGPLCVDCFGLSIPPASEGGDRS